MVYLSMPKAYGVSPHLKMFLSPRQDYLQEIKTVKELE